MINDVFMMIYDVFYDVYDVFMMLYDVFLGEKLFKCDICGKSYTRNQTLKYHVIAHTGKYDNWSFLCVLFLFYIWCVLSCFWCVLWSIWYHFVMCDVFCDSCDVFDVIFCVLGVQPFACPRVDCTQRFGRKSNLSMFLWYDLYVICMMCFMIHFIFMIWYVMFMMCFMIHFIIYDPFVMFMIHLWSIWCVF